MTSDSEDEEIDVGVETSELRLWRAREAMRQAELRLTTQAASKQAFEMRATALLGWIVAVSSLVGAGFVAASVAGKGLALAALLLPLLVAGGICIRIIWPQRWAVPGDDPRKVMSDEFDTELEAVESMAISYADGIGDNASRLRSAGLYMRFAFLLSMLGPLAGAAVLLFWFTVGAVWPAVEAAPALSCRMGMVSALVVAALVSS